MSKDQWTKEDFIEIARSRIVAGMAKPSTFHQHLYSFLAEATPHYEGATADGKAYIDSVMNGIVCILDLSLQNSPDTAETRKLKRSVSSAQGKHFLAEDLIKVFEEIPETTDEWMVKAVDLFTRTLQSLLNIMHDVTKGTQTGAACFARIGLFYWLIDELIAAQSLARRHHSTLSYTHLRCTMEILDKVELFSEKPDLAALWMSGDEKAIWKKLSPARVREKLAGKAFDPNKKSYDPVYEYLSQQGTHSTFTALKSRFHAERKSGNGDLKIAFTVGGVSSSGREISILMYCIMLINLAIIKALAAYQDRLNLEDVSGMVVGVFDDTFSFFNDFLASADELTYDKKPLETLLAASVKMRDSPLYKSLCEKQ